VATIEPFYQDLGHKIQQLRMSNRMTQEELGRELRPQLKRASIANIETGKQRVLSHTLIELARVLRTTVEDLLPKSPSASEIMSPTAGAVERELQEKLKLTDSHLKRLAKKMKIKRDIQ